MRFFPVKMSTQTGIRANDELRQFFAKCRETNGRDRFRMIKVVIKNEVRGTFLVFACQTLGCLAHTSETE